ncbi:MAG: hypothetical protein NTV01_08400 [Bacteroidia bacterium]|nr:hypothetical protein [Bacteroidia bacterium]
MPTGNIDSFSETNSAVYKNGAVDLIVRSFQQTETQQIEEQSKEDSIDQETELVTEIIDEEQATNTIEIITGSPDEKVNNSKQEDVITEATTTEAVQLEQSIMSEEATSVETVIPETETIYNQTETTTIETAEPLSFLEQVGKFFGGGIVKAKQTPSFEELTKKEFKSAKIKFSFAIFEKKPDDVLIIDPQTIDGEQATNTGAEINGENAPEIINFFGKIKNLFAFLTNKINEITDALVSKMVLIAKAEEGTSTISGIEPFAMEQATTEASVLIIEESVTEEEATSTEAINIEKETSTDATTTEFMENSSVATTTINEGTTTAVTETEETEESLSSVDAKIRVLWSLDGENWQILYVISSYPLSNSLNNLSESDQLGDYFSFAAPFLKNWDDVKNLQIKFEGIVGGETKFTAFLDSVWVEAEYQEEEEKGEFELRPVKKDWRADETPEFDVIPKGEDLEKNIVEKFIESASSIFKEEPKVGANLINPDKKEKSLHRGIDFSHETHSPTKIKIFRQEGFVPGLHKLEINYEKDGKTYYLEQEFTWGVLAINTNKSIYLPGETAYLQMAALKDDGHTLCYANLKLEIILPNGSSTFPEIKNSGSCGPDNVTDKPDYFSYQEVGETGIYQMKLTNLDNGYEISDSFEARESVPFDIERIGPTRIYPPAKYEIKLKIKLNQDFKGEIKETVPDSFAIEIENDEYQMQSATSGEKMISWSVDWKAGEEHELKYQFDAPDISPYMHLLGPLSFENNDESLMGGIIKKVKETFGSENSEFSEARYWQIASDAATTRIFVTSTAATTWTVPAGWNSASNTIEVIGGAGSGGDPVSGGGSGGGGGGAYSKIINLVLTSNATVTIQVGLGGAAPGNGVAGKAGRDTFFNRTSGSATSCTAGTMSICAKGGNGGTIVGTAGTIAAGGAGGTTTSSIGSTTYAGGNGGAGHATADSGGAGGGAGAPGGAGKIGGNSYDGDPLTTDGAGGGGGAGGASSTAGVVTAGGTGGAGGKGPTNQAGGTGGSGGNGGDGSNGSGGGGSDNSAGANPNGGGGGAGQEWQSSGPYYGAGGGAGGGSNSNTGGNGGLYGGGGGGGETAGGTGGQGIIVITYTPLDVISGTVFTDEGYTSSTAGSIVSLAINGTKVASTTASAANGSYSIYPTSTPAAGTAIHVYLDNSSEKGVTVTRHSGSGDLTGLDIYKDHIIVRDENSGPITIADLDKYDSGQDPDILYLASSTAGTLTASSTSDFFVWQGDTFGNYVTSGVAATTSFADLDIRGTFTASSSQVISVSGKWDATTTAVFNSASSTVLFTSTLATTTIRTDGYPFYNLTFNGSGGVWTFQDAATTTNDLTITAGTASSSYDMYVYGGDVTGNGILNWTGGTFMLDGTGYFGGASPWTFNNLTVGSGSGETTIETFSTAGTSTWAAPADVNEVDFLIVAGGGGGGAGASGSLSGGGGGGAGGLIAGNTKITPEQTYDIVIGAGGAGGVFDNPCQPGGSGSDSSFDEEVAVGGGGGGAQAAGTGKNGGSGGGAGAYSNTGGQGTTTQGNDGGSSVEYSIGAGGGGGASELGADTPNVNDGGNGGDGVPSDISGSALYSAGGGGGGGRLDYTAGDGGLGGGGAGSDSASAPTAGTDGLGGGGGGHRGGSGAIGGSGVVIIRYALPGTITATSTATTTISGVLTIASNQTLNAGQKPWVLSGSGTPFMVNGTFNSATSTFYYTSVSNTTSTATTYYNLNLAPSGSGSPTYNLGSGDFVVNNNLIIITEGGGGADDSCVSGGGLTCTTTYAGAYTINKFTTDNSTATASTTWTVPSGVTQVEYLVIGGGGGGGGYGGGGGGGGGFITGITNVAGSVLVQVGGGGLGGYNAISQNASSGKDSIFATTTSTGGGFGGYYNSISPETGGSGGGGVGLSRAGAASSPVTSPVQGYKGGDSLGEGAGGGGGAGQEGYPSDANPSYNAGAGGSGRSSSITGASTTYAGGGGGGGYSGGSNGAGGAGGGGAGGALNHGTNGLGGGGGGSYSTDGGGNGGAGVVIIRYLAPSQVTVTAETNNPTLDINGNIAISASSTFIAPNSASFTISGNWANTGTFTHSSGTTTFDGSGTSTLSGATTFYNFNSITPSKTLVFATGTSASTTVAGTFTLNGQATTTKIKLLSTQSGSYCYLNALATTSVDYVDVKDNNATGSASVIIASNSTDSGNNVKWSFTSLTVSGTIYSNEGTTIITPSPTISLIKNSTFYASTTATGTGVYAFSSVSASANDTLTAYLDGTSTKGAVVTITNGTTSISDFDIYADHVIVRDDNTRSGLTVSNMSGWDKDNDADILFDASSTLNVYSSNELYIWPTIAGKFKPGANVSTHDLKIASSSSSYYASSTQAITVSGSYSNNGTFNSASSTITFTSVSAEIISGNLNATSSFYNLTFNGSGGVWTLQGSASTTHDLTTTLGTASSSYDMYDYGGNVTGNGTLNWSGGTFLLDGTGYFGGTSAWTFSNLTFGNGSGSETNTATSTGTTTISSVLTIASSQTLSAGQRPWVLSGSNTPFVKTGTFTPASSTFYYTSVSNTTSTATTYYNLNLAPSGSGSPTYNLGSGAFVINNNLIIITEGGGGADNSCVSGGGLTCTTTYDGAYTINKFTLSGTTTASTTWTVPAGVTEIEYLVVAGGGGGGGISSFGFGGGGGGAGGLLSSTSYAVSPVSYDITVGSGGAGGATGPYSGSNGTLSAFDSIISTGGGGGAGGDALTYGKTGGSGGGGVHGASTGGSNISGQGQLGGGDISSSGQGGGGGGSSQIGGTGENLNTGYGGNGTQSNITGSLTYYAGGGSGGSGNTNAVISDAGLGGGGKGGTQPFSPGNNGTFYGGGAGGGTSARSGDPAEPGGNGYMGVVIIRYLTPGGSVTVTAATNNPTLDINNNLSISTSSTFIAPSSASFTIAGNWANTGTFTHSNGTTTFDGSGTSTFSGATTFYNFNSITPSKTLVFATGTSASTTVAGKLTLNGGASGTKIKLLSTQSGSYSYLNALASTTVNYVDVKDNNATGSANIIVAGNSTDSGNNVKWSFGGGTGATISGTIYSNEGTTIITPSPTISLIKNSTFYASTTANGSGVYTFSVSASSSDILTAYLDGTSTKGAVVTITNGTTSISDFDIYADHIIARDDNTRSGLTVSNMSNWDKDNDADILFDASSTLNVYSPNELYIWPTISGQFNPLANVSTHDLKIASSSSTYYASSTQSITISGSYSNTGILNAASSTITFTSTGTETISGNLNATSSFYNLTFNGSGGVWTLQGAASTTHDLTITLGTASSSYDMYVYGGNVTGNGTLNWAGTSTFLVDETGNFGGTTAWTFYNLTMGNGSGSATTSLSASATTTVTNFLTIAANQVLNAGTGVFDIQGHSVTSVPFVISGTFNAQTSTIAFTTDQSTNIPQATYYNLHLIDPPRGEINRLAQQSAETFIQISGESYQANLKKKLSITSRNALSDLIIENMESAIDSTPVPIQSAEALKFYQNNSGSADPVYSLKSLDSNLIEIGVQRHSPPQPYLKLNKWDGEASLKVHMPFVVDDAAPSYQNGKMTYRGKDKTTDKSVDVEFYAKQPEKIVETDSQGGDRTYTINENGGVEFDTIIYEKPETNSIVYPMETQNLDFFYQGPLSEENKDEALVCTETECKDKDNNIVSYRPENVVGSYAVYYKDGKSGDFSKMGGKNYMAGKAFHIYRPKVIDAAGNETWGELNIDIETNAMTVTVPQKFLDKAAYPVTVDPTFGYTTQGSSAQSLTQDMFYGSKFTSPAVSGVFSDIFNHSYSSGSFQWKGVITDSSLNIITNGTASARTHPNNIILWDTINFFTRPSLSASTDYFIGFIYNANGSASDTLSYDTGSANQGAIDTSNSYTTPTNPTDAGLGTQKFSFFAVYNVGVILASNVQGSYTAEYNTGGSITIKRAQKFTAGATDYVGTVIMPFLKNAAPTDNITCDIYSDNSGTPNVSLQASSNTIAGSGLSTTITNYIEFTFDGSLQLASGTDYWLVVSRSGAADDTNYYGWSGDYSNVYGVVKIYNGADWNGATGAKGLQFSIYAAYADALSGTTYTLGTTTGQTFTVNNNLVIGNANDTMSVTAATWNPTIDVNGNVSITASSTFIAAPSSLFTIAGDWANTGTFTHSNGTTTFDGSGTSTFSGATTFYNFNSITPSKALVFATGTSASTTIAGTLTLNGGASGTKIKLLSTQSGSYSYLNALASTSVDYVDVKDNNATGSANIIVAGNSTDSGNNVKWSFGGGTGATISGTIYSNEGTTIITPSPTISLIKNSTFYASTTANGSGVYTFSNVSASSSDILTAYLDGTSTKGAVVTVTDGSTDILDFDIYASHIIVRDDNTRSGLTVANMSGWDKDNDSDILFDASSTLNVYSPSELYVWGTIAGKFKPGANVSTHDLKIASSSSVYYASSTQSITISGSYSNNGTFNSASSTITFTSTGTETISGNLNATSSFYNLTFNGSGGVWTLQGAASTTHYLTTTLGTASSSYDMYVYGGNVTGNGTLNWSGGTFMVDGTGYFGGTSAWIFSNLTFGNGSGSETNTATSTGTTTVSGILTIAPSQTLNAGSKTWNIGGYDTTNTPFRINGIFTASSSTFRYTTGKNTNITATTYYNLELANSTATLDLAVSAGGDDGWYGTGYGFADSNGDNMAGNFNNAPGKAWMRWTGVSGLQGAIITAAYVETMTWMSYANTHLTIKANNIAAPISPTSSTTFNAFTYTTASVNWDPTDVTKQWYRSPDISNVIQELVSLNPSAILIAYLDNSSAANACYDFWGYETSNGPKLHIEYINNPTYTLATTAGQALTVNNNLIIGPEVIVDSCVSGGGLTCTRTHDGAYAIDKFTTDNSTATASTTWIVPSGVTQVEYLVIGGGGPGGAYVGGGGGAGGFRAGTTTVSGSAVVQVGGGGTPAENGLYGLSGGNSIFSTTTAAGGGYGGTYTTANNGANGGSGGGSANGATGGLGNTPTTTPSQGKNGGNGVSGGGAGGGGGANNPGVNGQAGYISGAGGNGTTSSITGSPIYYAGGGGGSGYNVANGGAGGLGGGGAGGRSSPSIAGTNGTDDLGGGGGGGNSTAAGTGRGGSGVVIIRYLAPSRLTVTAAINNPTLDINGNLAISTSSTFIAPSSAAFTVAGNWANTGTFTHSNGTTTFDGSGTSTFSGATTFYNFNSITPSKALVFATGTSASTTVAGKLTLNGGASGTKIKLLSTQSGSYSYLNALASTSVDYVDVKDNNATGSANIIVAGNSTDSGNNVKWSFGLTVSGTIYSDVGTTIITPSPTISLIKNSTFYASTTANGSGVYTFSVSASASDTLTAYLDGTSTKGAVVTITNGTTSISDFDIYASHIIVRDDNTRSGLTIANMSNWDKDNDADILFDASSTLNVYSPSELYVWGTIAGKFKPGANVSTHDLKIASSSSVYYSTSTNSITISGSYSNNGTFNSASSTITFTSTGTETISGNLNATSSLYKLTFNGTNGAWTIQDAMKVSAANASDTVLIKQGTVTIGNGNGDNLEVLGKFTVGDGTGNATLTTATLAQGDSLTIHINSTSTPSCLNCIISVGSTAGSGTFNIKKNVILQFNSATSVESGLEVNSTGYLWIEGSNDATNTVSTISEDSASTTLSVAGTPYATNQHQNKNLRITSGYAFGKIYGINSNGTGNININATNSATDLAPNVQTGTYCTTTSPTCIIYVADNLFDASTTQVGRYLYNITDSKYYQIVANTEAATDTVTIVRNLPDDFNTMNDNDDVKIVDGIKANDTFEIFDYAQITANAASHGYIYAMAGSETLMRYADISEMGTNTANKYGVSFYNINGANSNEGITIEKSRIHDGGYYGIYLNNSSSSNSSSNKGFSNNAVYGNSDNGFPLISSNNNTLSQNNIYGNSVLGFYLYSSNNNTFSQNNSYGNGSRGFYINNSSNNNTLSQNNSYGNSGLGFFLDSSNNNTLFQNNSYGNSDDGFLLSYSNNNTFFQNNSYSNGSRGFYVTQYSNNNTLSQNNSYGQNQGFSLSYSNNTLSQNNSYGNAYGLLLSYSNNNTLSQNNSYGNAYGFSIFNSTGTILFKENYSTNTSADIYFSDDATGSTAVCYYCTFSSATEVTGVTYTGAYFISYKHDGNATSTKVWGEYRIPSDDSDTPQTESTNKFNYTDNLWEDSIARVNWYDDGTASTKDTNLNFSFGAGLATTSALYRATCSSTTSTFQVYRNETYIGNATTGVTFTDATTNLSFKIDGSNYTQYDTYSFVAFAKSNNTSTRKVIEMMQAGDTFTVASGTALEIKGGGISSSDVTLVTSTASWALYNNSGSELTFQEAIINSAQFASGTVTVLNTILNNESVTSTAILNVDWYLGTHAVADDSTSTNIGNATCTVSEITASSTVWKHNGSTWGSGATSQVFVTQTGSATGTNAQPNSSGAIRIREYRRTSSATSTYKYNLQIVSSGGFTSYDYYVKTGHYITSTSSSESTSTVNRCISESWYRSTIGNLNGSKDYDGLNQMPQHGTWYAGMGSDLQFSLNPGTVSLDLRQANDFTDSYAIVLSATTSYPNGFIIKAHMADTLGKLTTSTAEIIRFPQSNSSPVPWTLTCNASSTCCGFGYTTNDSSLPGATPNRFTSPTSYAGFATSTLSTDPVATGGTGSYTVTIKASVNNSQRAENYAGTIYFIATAYY